MDKLFKWSGKPLLWSEYCAWIKEAKAEVDRRKAAGDPLTQTPALFSNAAARRLIAHFVGEDWYLRYAMPGGAASSYFHPKFTGPRGEAAEYTARIFNFAECFFNLQHVENFRYPVGDLQNASQIESALAEMQVGMILMQDAIPFKYIPPHTVEGVRTADLEISIGNTTAYCDVKCKFDDTAYYDGCFKSSFKAAREQIGKGNHGFVFVKVPQTWLAENGEDIRVPPAVVAECKRQMRGTSRIVKTIFYTFHLTYSAESMTNRHAIAEVNSPRLEPHDPWNARVFPCDGRGQWINMLDIIEKALAEPQVLTPVIYEAASQPKDFQTHRHPGNFWEELGRTVATFGFLEEVLGKAIFSLTATLDAPTSDPEAAYAQFLSTLERALSDPLGALIDTYGKAVRNNPASTITNIEFLLEKLREASKLRNVICHGAWRTPDELGASVPFFVSNKKEIFEGAIDLAFLSQSRAHTVELICAVMNSVTTMGFQFPGSNGPGKPVVSPGHE